MFKELNPYARKTSGGGVQNPVITRKEDAII